MGQIDWSSAVFAAMKARDIKLVGTVPDAGLTGLLRLCEDDADTTVVTLTTEEEGIGLSLGAWLGGRRSALLIQSSGVGNCINALSVPATTRTPCLMVVTMRGEWGEFNPWQVPMGRATETVLEAMGVHCLRADRAEEIEDGFVAAAGLAIHGHMSAALLIGQRALGAKAF